MTLRSCLIFLFVTACGPATELDVSSSTAPIASAAEPSGCPPTWAEARARCSPVSSCTTPGASCGYRGVGDQLPSGQWADGLLSCFDPSGGTSDAGVGQWRCAQ